MSTGRIEKIAMSGTIATYAIALSIVIHAQEIMSSEGRFSDFSDIELTARGIFLQRLVKDDNKNKEINIASPRPDLDDKKDPPDP